jgi:subtilisin family serine protease
VIGVGAFDSNLNVASFSNRGVPIDVVAPGVGILSTTPVAGSKYTNNYASISGTSMATPHVAALAGLLAMASPGVSSDEVTRTIERSADLPQDGWSSDFGYGRIDAERAITGANWRKRHGRRRQRAGARPSRHWATRRNCDAQFHRGSQR